MSKVELYFSVDVESDGPIPLDNSMLSLGAAAFEKSGVLVGTFSANFELLPGANSASDTMKWWSSQPEAWAACRQNLEDPALAMRRFVSWVDLTCGPANIPVFVGYPAGYDFTFTYVYLRKFAGRSPFSHSALDIKSFAMAALKCDYRAATKRNMPKRWFSKHPHTHKALDDAIEQGELFVNILREVRKA